MPDNHATLLDLTAQIATAHVANNIIDAADVPQAITAIYGALAGLGQDVARTPEAPTPAVSVRASIKPDHIVCLEDGKKLKMLKRHIMTHYNLTPAQYRERWNLPGDYPMVAPNYADKRRELALKIGLGRQHHSRRPSAIAAGKRA